MKSILFSAEKMKLFKVFCWLGMLRLVLFNWALQMSSLSFARLDLPTAFFPGRVLLLQPRFEFFLVGSPNGCDFLFLVFGNRLATVSIDSEDMHF